MKKITLFEEEFSTMLKNKGHHCGLEKEMVEYHKTVSPNIHILQERNNIGLLNLVYLLVEKVLLLNLEVFLIAAVNMHNFDK